MSDGVAQFLGFHLDQRHFALPLTVVDRVVRAVDVTPLPQAPAIVMGVINVQGRVLPVLNVRRRFLMPDRDVTPADWFLVARTARHTVVLVVDGSDGVLARPEDEVIASTHFVPDLELFPGAIGLEEGLVLIHDLERFLSFDEARALDAALDRASSA